MSKSQSHKNEKKNSKQSPQNLKGKAAHKLPASEKSNEPGSIKEESIIPGNLAMKEVKGAQMLGSSLSKADSGKRSLGSEKSLSAKKDSNLSGTGQETSRPF
ncbi:MAG: hypothetical protein G8345_04475 [Magnetococcales bacterium]|nr:hypothetical protein [Magnetococcales bacterium]NGZ26127.1 hypothetical protein [Magnetococcales bacterium]